MTRMEEIKTIRDALKRLREYVKFLDFATKCHLHSTDANKDIDLIESVIDSI